jgi:hypothetical protein
MGHGTYLGGRSKIGISDNGTSWSTFDDAQSRSKARKPRVIRDHRPTKREIAEQERLDLIQEKALIREFISRCPREYACNKLTTFHPKAPPMLRKRVANAGGNVEWLARDPSYQIIFHRAYCKLRKDPNIPFDRVWGKTTKSIKR